MPDHLDTLIYHFYRLADGGRLRFTIREPVTVARGTVIVAPGRREFIEKKYAEVGQPFVEKGYRVVLFEWRGQGLSDRFLTGANRQRDYITDFDQHLRDFDAFYQAVLRPYSADPLILCGHSMGSHLLLRWMTEYDHAAITGAIVTAPMLALASLPVHGVAQAAAWLSSKFGHGEEYAAGQHDYDDRDSRFPGNPLSQDEQRFGIMERYFTSQPDMTVGGVTWGWLLAALRSMHQLQRPSALKRIGCPVLAITGGRDGVTPPHELAHYLKYVPRAENIVIPGALHDIMNELDLYRLEAWRQIDDFLGRIIPRNK